MNIYLIVRVYTAKVNSPGAATPAIHRQINQAAYSKPYHCNSLYYKELENTGCPQGAESGFNAFTRHQAAP
jgi:hypothetical protein